MPGIQRFWSEKAMTSGWPSFLSGWEMCDYASSAEGWRIRCHPYWSCWEGPAVAWGGPWHEGLARQPEEGPDLWCPTSELQRSASKKFRALRLFRYLSVIESFICFKELMAVVSDFHRKDILKLSKENWNEFAVLHLSKCYSHWPSMENILSDNHSHFCILREQMSYLWTTFFSELNYNL